ncbi:MULTISPECIES: hypothetical protein [unclassified Rhizobium]|uniref:hypothetical protein n=1 Tax=unclassified Rhizobium TaxID=2613769 RepID=UPI0011C467A1|nr:MULTISPECIES: hypothetical protein [unclassified Rhizobium]MBN8952436.1 hypothetical protein [Rhizobium tropici]
MSIQELKPVELDQISKATISRFIWKCNIAFAISLFSKSSHLLSASRCLVLYAFLMIVVAALTRQRFYAESFNHWSEALWLGFVAAGLNLLA